MASRFTDFLIGMALLMAYAFCEFGHRASLEPGVSYGWVVFYATVKWIPLGLGCWVMLRIWRRPRQDPPPD